MRGKAASGYRKSAKMKEVESEFGMPFHDVLAGFAADGNNRSQTAAILEYDRGAFYRKLQALDKAGYAINWPDGYATRQTPKYPKTPAQQAASAANLKTVNPTNRRPWGKELKVTESLARDAAALRATHLTWRVIANRLGVDISSLTRARKKFNTPDPVGTELIRQAQHKFSRSSRP